MSFQPVFTAAPDTTGKRLQGFEIYVDKQSGEVEAKLNPPDPSPSSFMLEAVVEDDGGGSPLAANAALRVHVHGSVTDLWLTPRKLATRRVKAAGNEEATQCRFAVRAQFDDGTVGDITESGELTFTPATWFDGSAIKIPATAADAVGEFDVTVKTSAGLGSKSATAKLEILCAWATEPDPLKAELIDGAPGVRDGTLKPERLPNVLFVSSGFTSADHEAFRDITSRVVEEMQKDKMQPFGYLARAIHLATRSSSTRQRLELTYCTRRHGGRSRTSSPTPLGLATNMRKAATPTRAQNPTSYLTAISPHLPRSLIRRRQIFRRTIR